MNILNQITCSPNKDAINPELTIEITLSMFNDNTEVPLDISGTIISEDNKKLADISSLKFLNITQFYIFASINQQNNYQREVKIQLIVPLNQKVLDYIEDKRHKNIKGDANFKLALNIKYLVTKVVISHIASRDTAITNPQSRQPEPVNILTYQYSEHYRPNKNDLWILSGNGNQTLAEISILTVTKDIKISASDWIHDYCPIFCIGKFFVIDIPIIESFPKLPVTPPTTTPPTTTSPTTIPPATFSEKYNAAVDSLSVIQSNLIEGDWNTTIDKSRSIFELLRNNENEIKELFILNGYTEEAYKEFNESLKSLFNFASKFHHKLDSKSKTLVGDFNATREDAYLIYTMSFSIVNAIAQKIKRFII